MPGSPRKKRGEFPVKATGTQKARPTDRGKARRYTVVGARGGEAAFATGIKVRKVVLTDCLLRLRA
jgi:hypothetical protein